jgi:hypothetical protein
MIKYRRAIILFGLFPLVLLSVFLKSAGGIVINGISNKVSINHISPVKQNITKGDIKDKKTYANVFNSLVENE